MRQGQTAVNRGQIIVVRQKGIGVLADVLTRFGKKLREARQKKGISQERLAELADLHRTYVSSIERGERNVSLVNIEKLARALGLPMSALMP